MEELIRFRWLNDQLNNEEFTQFISECIKSVFSSLNGRIVFTKMMFKAFENTPSQIIPFTEITTKIIDSRESKQKQEIDSFDKFDNLPSEMISECASFLETTDYVHFGHSNRKIYKSIYSPFAKIQRLSYNAFMHYPQTLSMKRFKNINHLSIDIEYFNDKITSLNKSIWKIENKLNTLEIEPCYDENQIIQFIENKQMDLTNIKKLELRELDFVTISFCHFISHFPNIECLVLYDVNSRIDHDVNDENISNILKSVPNLKHLDFNDYSNICPLIVTAFNDKLESLALQFIDHCDISSSIKFPKLRELCLYSPYSHDFSILDRTQNLKTAKLEMNEYEFYHDHDPEECMQITKQFINKVINQQLLLQHLIFDINAQLFDATMSELELAIFASTNNHQRKSKHLLIEFEINEWESKLMQNMDLKVMRLVHLLTAKELKLDDFRIKIKIKHIEEFDESSINIKKWLNKLEMLKKSYFIQYGFTKNKVYEFTFSISNKNYKIDI